MLLLLCYDVQTSANIAKFRRARADKAKREKEQTAAKQALSQKLAAARAAGGEEAAAEILEQEAAAPWAEAASQVIKWSETLAPERLWLSRHSGNEGRHQHVDALEHHVQTKLLPRRQAGWLYVDHKRAWTCAPLHPEGLPIHLLDIRNANISQRRAMGCRRPPPLPCHNHDSPHATLSLLRTLEAVTKIYAAR